MDERVQDLCWVGVEDLLEVAPFPPRERDSSLDFLISSVRLHGVLSPLLVREIDAKASVASYQLISGYRRLLAARAAQLSEVPVLVTRLGDAEAIRCYLAENMCRQDLPDASRDSALELLQGLRAGAELEGTEFVASKPRRADEFESTNLGDPNGQDSAASETPSRTWSGEARSGEARSGEARSGEARSGEARSGEDSSRTWSGKEDRSGHEDEDGARFRTWGEFSWGARQWDGAAEQLPSQPGVGEAASDRLETAVAGLLIQVRELFDLTAERRSIDMSRAEAIVDDLLALPPSVHPMTVPTLLDDSADETERRREWLARHSLEVASLSIVLLPKRAPPLGASGYALAGLLHDIGMVFLPESCYGEPTAEEDRRVVSSHARIGHAIVVVAGKQYAEIALAARDHHETLDGSGYPGGLRGGQIGHLARTSAIADTFRTSCEPVPSCERAEPDQPQVVLAEIEAATRAGVFDAVIVTRLQGLCQDSVEDSLDEMSSPSRLGDPDTTKTTLPIEFY